ncbi:hypothetical protein BDW72DRAFT_207962 [Aspergillus terricola var. indicus]
MTARRQVSAPYSSPHQYTRHFPALESQPSHPNQLSANRFLVPNTGLIDSTVRCLSPCGPDRAPHFPSHGDLVQLREPCCNQASSVRRFAYVVDLGKLELGLCRGEGILSLRITRNRTQDDRALLFESRLGLQKQHSLEYLAHWRLPAHWAELGDKQFNHQVCPTPSLRNQTLITRSITTVVPPVFTAESKIAFTQRSPFYPDLPATEHRTLRTTAGNTGHHSLSTQLQWLWINKASHSLMAFPHIQDTLQVSGTLRITPQHPLVTTNPDRLHPNISIRSTQVYHRTAIILEAQTLVRWPLALNHNLLYPQERFTRHPILRLFQQTHRHIVYYRVQRSQGVLIMDVMAANSQPSAISCVTKEKSRALWRKQSVQAVALSSRVPLREIFTLLKGNARRPEETHPVARMRYPWGRTTAPVSLPSVYRT